MNLDKYSITSDDSRLTYEFLSEGPKGTIKKVVLYQEIGEGVYNLAFWIGMKKHKRLLTIHGQIIRTRIKY